MHETFYERGNLRAWPTKLAHFVVSTVVRRTSAVGAEELHVIVFFFNLVEKDPIIITMTTAEYKKNRVDLSDLEDEENATELNLSASPSSGLLRDADMWSKFKSLKKLDLNSNSLTELPLALECLAPTLDILFLSENKFEVMPEVIGKLNNLRMLSLRGNKLTELSSSNLPAASLVWLILTNNQISRIDPSVQDLKHLRKLMLSHNKITSIPAELGACSDLELIRLANNEISVPLPKDFLTLPKLAWISLAGNPIAHCPQTKEKEILKS